MGVYRPLPFAILFLTMISSILTVLLLLSWVLFSSPSTVFFPLLLKVITCTPFSSVSAPLALSSGPPFQPLKYNLLFASFSTCSPNLAEGAMQPSQLLQECFHAVPGGDRTLSPSWLAWGYDSPRWNFSPRHCGNLTPGICKNPCSRYLTHWFMTLFDNPKIFMYSCGLLFQYLFANHKKVQWKELCST